MYVCLTPLFGDIPARYRPIKPVRPAPWMLEALGPPPSLTLPSDRSESEVGAADQSDRKGGGDQQIALLLDLPLEETLELTPALMERGFFVVPVSQRWAAQSAVLDSAALVANLAAYAPTGRVHAPRGLVLLLDGQRLGDTLTRRQAGGDKPLSYRTERPRPRQRTAEPTERVFGAGRFDNRYRYPLCRFPPPALMREHQVAVVRWISDDGIATDLVDYAERLASADLPPEVRGRQPV
jgi:hypothetical protein